MSSLAEISQLEMNEAYPQAIEALEMLLQEDPNNIEVVTRLGFNLWYAAQEAERMRKMLPVASYRQRFLDLLREHTDKGSNSGEFCWAFGLGLHLFWYNFHGATETMGVSLLSRAEKLDPFWGRMRSGEARQDEINLRFKDKGIFAKYYNVD